MDRALTDDISITQRGRKKAVLISYKAYQRFLTAMKPKITAMKTDEIPNELFNTLVRPLTKNEYDNGGIQKLTHTKKKD